MPLHSLARLSPTAVLGLWRLTETPAELWRGLPQAAAYRALAPATADATRQAQWVAGRVLVHELLAELLPGQLGQQLVVHNDATGRPWLAGAARGLLVSLSHSGAWVAAVLARGGRAGVDVEMIRDKAQRLAGKFLATPEWAEALAATQKSPETASAHYTLLWSAKETLYKLAARRGIVFREQLRLGSFAPQESGEIPATLMLNGALSRHCVCYFQPAPGYVLTYCYEPGA
ncbi:4'-phosphopantetheinyl transferase superfamily protein [Hymenobacter sp.]|uniref:4'-phosphopantetheinyl transferase family protein n=1 Tax=Hymenobacter sp. TaxID=1898978 RepID=UPI00286C0F80|nr:4'-phosphopantetheinyl transferase superfamily protein [Hymenobacter sp.]